MLLITLICCSSALLAIATHSATHIALNCSPITWQTEDRRVAGMLQPHSCPAVFASMNRTEHCPAVLAIHRLKMLSSVPCVLPPAVHASMGHTDHCSAVLGIQSLTMLSSVPLVLPPAVHASMDHTDHCSAVLGIQSLTMLSSVPLVLPPAVFAIMNRTEHCPTVLAIHRMTQLPFFPFALAALASKHDTHGALLCYPQTDCPLFLLILLAAVHAGMDHTDHCSAVLGIQSLTMLPSVPLVVPPAVLASMNRTATEHCYAAQALLWSQLGPADHAHVTPSLLLKSASHGEPE
eukprot:1161223-Pelagomonas_calceolata.AAC.6